MFSILLMQCQELFKCYFNCSIYLFTASALAVSMFNGSQDRQISKVSQVVQHFMLTAFQEYDHFVNYEKHSAY